MTQKTEDGHAIESARTMAAMQEPELTHFEFQVGFLGEIHTVKVWAKNLMQATNTVIIDKFRVVEFRRLKKPAPEGHKFAGRWGYAVRYRCGNKDKIVRWYSDQMYQLINDLTGRIEIIRGKEIEEKES